jgi:hypothetical protein
MWRRRQLPVLVAVVAVMAAGCARSDGRQPAGLGPATLSPDARLVAAGSNEFVLSGDTLNRVQDGRLVTVARALPPAGSAPRAVAFDGARGVIAARDGATVIVFTSSDAGRTWTKTARQSLSQAAPEGVGELEVALADGRIVVLAREVTSSNFASAVVLTSSDDGATWKLRQAPTAGRLVTASGLFWLVGGVEGDQVYASDDGTNWASVRLPADAQSWSVGSPAAVRGTGTIIAVTVHKTGGASTVILFRSADLGRTWSVVASVAVAAHTEAGTTVPVAITADGDWFVVQADGSRVYRGNVAGHASSQTISPNGLTSGVEETAFFSSTDGMALVARSSCPSGKDSCRTTEAALRTPDGGQTWEQMTVE